jgi:signal transduction histidine kinase
VPLFEVERSARGRHRVFLRAQFPFLVGAAFVALMTALALPQAVLAWTTLTGYALVILASIAALWVPWERYRSMWMITIAIADLLAVALIRAELVSALPSVTILAMFPILWLAYGFDWLGIVVAVLGAVFITSFGFGYGANTFPATALEWARIVTLPTLIVGVAIIVFVAARQLRRNAKRLADARAAQDIALRQAQDAETIARSILNTVTAGVAYYDVEGRLQAANDLAHRMVEMVGFRLDEPPYAGDNVLAADRTSTIAYENQIIPRALRGEVIEEHVEWLGPPDAQVAIMASARRVRRDDGELIGTVIVAYDVTELADAIEVREQFLRTVSHELRTPITSITGFLDLIDDALDPAEVRLRGYLDVVTRKTNDLLDRVSDLLTANDDDRPLRLVDVDLVPVVQGAVDRVRELADSRGSAIGVRVPDALSARVDPERFSDALAELVTNAVKFGEPGAPVRVELERQGDRITASVSNSGVGITRAEQTRIFDRFYRAPYARSQAIQGFGLGLTKVKAAVTAHGGHVRIESESGGRTTFTMDIPAA